MQDNNANYVDIDVIFKLPIFEANNSISLILGLIHNIIGVFI